MLKEFVEKIVSLSSAIETKEIGDDVYSRNSLTRIKKMDQYNPDTLKFSTLKGLVDLIYEADPCIPKPLFFMVESPVSVSVLGPLQGNNENKRFEFANATMNLEGFLFDRYMPLEKFVIGLQSQFVNSDSVQDLISMLGSVASSHVQENHDTGFSQSIQLKVGIQLKENVRVTNPVTLAPYRTFREVEQPESNFILRFHENREKILEAALFEGDGGAWRIKAMENIKAWLKENTIIPVIA